MGGSRLEEWFEKNPRKPMRWEAMPVVQRDLHLPGEESDDSR